MEATLYDILPKTQIQGDAAEASLSRGQLVERIVAHNPTASPTFLSCFDDAQLLRYFEHLCCAAAPRGAGCAAWVRRNGSPAIDAAEPED